MHNNFGSYSCSSVFALKLTLAVGDVKCGLIGGNAIGSSDRKLLPVCAFRDRGCQAPTI